MIERSGLRLVEKGTTKFSDGSELTAYRERKKSTRKAGNTAIHEMKHSYLQEKLRPHTVKKTSIIPGPGYLGITEVTNVHEVAAAGPSADYMSGTQHDEHVVEAIGGNLGAARTVARSMMAGNEGIIYEAACDLEERGTMSGEEIRSSIREAELGKEIVLFFSDADGNQIQLRQDIEEPIYFPVPVWDYQEAA